MFNSKLPCKTLYCWLQKKCMIVMKCFMFDNLRYTAIYNTFNVLLCFLWASAQTLDYTCDIYQ